MDWKSDVLQQIEQREQRNKLAGSDSSDSYEQVLQRLIATEKKLKLFQKEDIQIELQNRITELEKTSEENVNLGEINKFLLKEGQSKTKEIKKLTHSVKLLIDKTKRLEDKIIVKNEENLAKNKALESVNDDILALQLENNLLNDRVKLLEHENSQLVLRWMNKVKEDAEKLNDANAFLANVKKN